MLTESVVLDVRARRDDPGLSIAPSSTTPIPAAVERGPLRWHRHHGVVSPPFGLHPASRAASPD
jgi:hypothetical protein